MDLKMRGSNPSATRIRPEGPTGAAARPRRPQVPAPQGAAESDLRAKPRGPHVPRGTAPPPAAGRPGGTPPLRCGAVRARGGEPAARSPRTGERVRGSRCRVPEAGTSSGGPSTAAETEPDQADPLPPGPAASRENPAEPTGNEGPRGTALSQTRAERGAPGSRGLRPRGRGRQSARRRLLTSRAPRAPRSAAPGGGAAAASTVTGSGPGRGWGAGNGRGWGRGREGLLGSGPRPSALYGPERGDAARDLPRARAP